MERHDDQSSVANLSRATQKLGVPSQRTVLTSNTVQANELVYEIDKKVGHVDTLCVIPFIASMRLIIRESCVRIGETRRTYHTQS